MSDLTPTPPADTRQQAVQRLRDTLSVVQGSIPTYSSRHALMGDALADLNILAAALASSSPAPPAPARILTDLYRTAFDEWMAEASVDGPRVKFLHGRADAFAEAIRALELPLLAAADVAEEQQP